MRRLTLEEQIEAGLPSDRDPVSCWLWTKKLWARGYGRVFVKGKSKLAHRMYLELLGVQIPHGFEVHHKCRNRACMNPAHLQVLSPEDHDGQHLDRGEARGRQQTAKTHCPSGHPYDAKNTYHWRGFRMCRACHAGDRHPSRVGIRSKELHP